jgi:hypothetical protein
MAYDYVALRNIHQKGETGMVTELTKGIYWVGVVGHCGLEPQTPVLSRLRRPS